MPSFSLSLSLSRNSHTTGPMSASSTGLLGQPRPTRYLVAVGNGGDGGGDGGGGGVGGGGFGVLGVGGGGFVKAPQQVWGGGGGGGCCKCCIVYRNP
jgi:hypothetical protein